MNMSDDSTTASYHIAARIWWALKGTEKMFSDINVLLETVPRSDDGDNLGNVDDLKQNLRIHMVNVRQKMMDRMRSD